MKDVQSLRIKTVTAYHRLLELPKPEHPLISFINLGSIKREPMDGPLNLIFDFYTISLKKNFNVKMKYGQQPHDFDEGVLHFMSPRQVLSLEFEKDVKHEPLGWVILIHPDFLWDTPLAKTIKHYGYFDYSVNEALYLSDKEETLVTDIAKNIEMEYHNNIDHFSQNIIISQLEVLLNYAERFYQRQFITRKISNHGILSRLETLLNTYFQSKTLAEKGLPTVSYIAESLNISPNYLNSLLKSLTGQSTQQHLHHKLIELAKEKLSTTDLTVSEIAYQLGFEHLQSFSKLFKIKTNFSPSEFRSSLN